MVTTLSQYVGDELQDDWIIINDEDSFLIGMFLGRQGITSLFPAGQRGPIAKEDRTRLKRTRCMEVFFLD